MAESIVKVLLTKLTDVGVKKVLQLYSIDDQVETVTRQLGWIQAFMKDADRKQITDERQKHWVKEMRDVAYLIEDAIDTFLSEVSPKPQKPIGMMESMKKKLKTTKELPVVHKLVHEITQIQTRLTEIETSRVRYGINTLGEDRGEIKMPIRPPVLPDIVDPEIVGFKEDQDHVVKKLLDETTKNRSVISIWGAGGLGKTTLAQKVYNCVDIKTQFELRIWVAISQKFELIDILRKVAKQLQLPIDPSKQSNDFLTEIHTSLRDKKYLIVFDDVWTEELWTQIGEALPNENNGSRVLITTRSSEVAKDADPTCEPYKLGFLTKELSVDLFLKKALPNYDPNESTFHNLSDITAQFVQKCGALPLALVVLGGLLSRKPRNYTAWSKVLQTMSWHTDGRKCNEIIGTSYEDLSLALKQCFMYFAAYPEDYEIPSTSLLRMWVAEGFIPQEDNRTLEETAESYLEDLVQRSLVQVKSRGFDGSVNRCGIHDLLRDLAIQKAKEDNFLVVYSHPDCDQQSLSRARRVAVHHPDCDKLVMSQNLRTLLCFDGQVMPNFSKQKLLKVVTSSAFLESIDAGMFEGLCQLRYVNLRGNLSDKYTRPDDKYGKRYLEKLLDTMNCIQTLQVGLFTRGQTFDPYNFSDCAWNKKTLRHIWTGSSVPELPPSTQLSNLQTLIKVTTNESWKTGLPHLPNLRTLDLLHHKSCSWMVVVDFLGTLKKLISLNLEGSFSGDIFDMRKFPFYQNLQSLTLSSDNYEETPNEMATDVVMLPPHLIYLNIDYCHFQQDVMPVLENLHCLKSLTLWRVSKTNRKMRCSAKGFNQLEQLWLYDIIVLEDWEIEVGALPILRELSISGCKELCVPQGLRHLTNLLQLDWWLRGNNSKAYEVRHLCKHVPSLKLI